MSSKTNGRSNSEEISFEHIEHPSSRHDSQSELCSRNSQSHFGIQTKVWSGSSSVQDDDENYELDNVGTTGVMKQAHTRL
jgi:hypothetical protein